MKNLTSRTEEGRIKAVIENNNIATDDINKILTLVGLLSFENPDMLAGDLIRYAMTGSWDDTTEKCIHRGSADGDSALMALRVLIYRLRKYDGPGGKADSFYKMMTRLGYFKSTDILR